jgi:hypothetical protein
MQQLCRLPTAEKLSIEQLVQALTAAWHAAINCDRHEAMM